MPPRVGPVGDGIKVAVGRWPGDSDGMRWLPAPRRSLVGGLKGIETLGLGREFVVLGRQEVVHVADGLEEDVKTGLILERPEHAAMLKPCVGKDAV
jgi:hypothetical protein